MTTIESNTQQRPTWLPQSEFPFTSRYADIDGHRIHYIDEGAGPVMLLLTGGVVWSFIFRDVILRLQEQFRVITLDLPGAGLSTAAPGFEQSLEGHSVVVESFIDALGLDDITFVAHDLGGPIGLGVYARRPERFRALAATGTFGFPLQGHPDIVKELRRFSGPATKKINRWFNVVALATSTRMGVGRHLSRAGRRAFRGPFDDAEIRDNGIDLLADALASGEYLERVERALNAAPENLPVLLLYGEKDPGRKAGFQRHFEEIFPNAHSKIVSGAHHFPFADDPGRVAQAISDWFTQDVTRS